jgi:hypothetical protein
VRREVSRVCRTLGLPGGVSEELGGALGKPEAGVGNDQAYAGEPTPLEKRPPPALSFVGALANPENPGSLTGYGDRCQR